MNNDRESAINYLADSGNFEVVFTVRIRDKERGFSPSIEVTLAELKTLLEEGGKKEFVKKHRLETWPTHELIERANSLRLGAS